jgi:hypothetical protein
MGWFRFVCSNGLVIGVTQIDIRRRHFGELNLADMKTVFSLGLKRAEAEKQDFRKWRDRPVPLETVASWVDKDVREQWGFKAATRVFHIFKDGYDVEIIGQYKGYKPTTVETTRTNKVPGCPKQSQNLFNLSQILAWLAKERRDIQEQLEWREQIPAILDKLR